jgi:hypothetical protein
VSRRVRRLDLDPQPVPVQLVLGLEGGLLAALGKRAKSRKYIPGGSFAPAGKAKAA